MPEICILHPGLPFPGPHRKLALAIVLSRGDREKSNVRSTFYVPGGQFTHRTRDVFIIFDRDYPGPIQ